MQNNNPPAICPIVKKLRIFPMRRYLSRMSAPGAMRGAVFSAHRQYPRPVKRMSPQQSALLAGNPVAMPHPLWRRYLLLPERLLFVCQRTPKSEGGRQGVRSPRCGRQHLGLWDGRGGRNTPMAGRSVPFYRRAGAILEHLVVGKVHEQHCHGFGKSCCSQQSSGPREAQ